MTGTATRLWALGVACSLVLLPGCREQRPQGARIPQTAPPASEFTALWESVRKTDDFERDACRFRGYYRDLVQLLPDNYREVASIVAGEDPVYVSCQLSALLPETNGERRIAVAELLAQTSNGYCEDSMLILSGVPVDSPTHTLAKGVLGWVQRRFVRHRGSYEYGEAAAVDIPVHVWHRMTDKERWEAILRATQEVRYDGKRDWDDPELLGHLTIENWWAVARGMASDEWTNAVRLEPVMLKAEGDRKVLLAVLVALLSYGNHEGAMGILSEAAKTQHSPVSLLARDILDTARDMRDTYDPEILRETMGLLYVARWSEMTPAQRWATVRDRLRELGYPTTAPG